MRPLFLCYDERMLLHQPLGWEAPATYPKTFVPNYVLENPGRLQAVYERLSLLPLRHPGCLRLCTHLEPATREEIVRVHSEAHYDQLLASATATRDRLLELSGEDPDLYYSPFTFLAATLACGGLLTSVRHALSTGESAMALVRPPGHHACQTHAMGFCFFNSVVVAAKSVERRVLILDWDIHHGNGTQDLVYDDPNILYVSLHRFSTGKGSQNEFFPYTGHPREVGVDGTNVNIAWTSRGRDNTAYAAALSEVVWPVVQAFDPELVLVSCGLDAAKGDLLGDACVTSDGYAAMTRSLSALVGDVPVVVALEGGYNISVISDCMEAIALALIFPKGEPDENVPVTTSTDDESQEDRTAHSGVLDKPLDETEPVTKETRLQAARAHLAPYWKYDPERCTGAGLSLSATRNLQTVMQHLRPFYSTFRPLVHRRKKSPRTNSTADLSQALSSLQL